MADFADRLRAFLCSDSPLWSMLRRRQVAQRGPDDPPEPTGGNFDVMCILPDGRRGFFDGRCLWTSTGTTIHSREDAESSARDMRRAYGARARFFVVDADYSDPWDPICDIDGKPVTRSTCEGCGFADVFDGPRCYSCAAASDD